VSKRIGLPVTLKMRHDAHYVESLTSYSGAAIGRMVPVDQIRPNPDQPRKAIGDLRELTDSIREKGVLEPLLVRFVPREDCYYIISGERRYHASRAAGLTEVPCIEKVADDAGDQRPESAAEERCREEHDRNGCGAPPIAAYRVNRGEHGRQSRGQQQRGDETERKKGLK